MKTARTVSLRQSGREFDDDPIEQLNGLPRTCPALGLGTQNLQDARRTTFSPPRPVTDMRLLFRGALAW
jgi:hypothetical protein